VPVALATDFKVKPGTTPAAVSHSSPRLCQENQVILALCDQVAHVVSLVSAWLCVKTHYLKTLRFVSIAWVGIDLNQVQKDCIHGYCENEDLPVGLHLAWKQLRPKAFSVDVALWSVRWEEPVQRSADVQLHHRRLVFSAVCVDLLYTSASTKGGVRSTALEGERSVRGRVGLSKVCETEAGPAGSDEWVQYNLTQKRSCRCLGHPEYWHRAVCVCVCSEARAETSHCLQPTMAATEWSSSVSDAETWRSS